MPLPSSLRGKSRPSVIYLTFHRNCLRIRPRRQRLAGYRRLHRATRCEQLRRNWEIKVYRLFTRGWRSAFASKTSSPSTSTWLEFVSQATIFMGPVGAILLGNGSMWGFVLGLATQPIPLSVIVNGASSLRVFSMPWAGQSVCTGTSEGPTILRGGISGSVHNSS